MLRLLALTLAIGGAAAQAPGAQPAPPEARTTHDPLAHIPAQRVTRPGATVPGTPPELNVSISVRYALTDQPRAILIIMPGFLGGAGSLDRLARQIVTLDPTLAVWAVDRRANQLETHDTIKGADPATLEIIARTGIPARPTQELTYMRDWGLDTTLRDWRETILEARAITPNVLIAGHSLGGAIAAQYAAYDFNGTPGHTDIRGIILLDGLPGTDDSKRLPEDKYHNGYWSHLRRIPGLQNLHTNPYLKVDGLLDPTFASRAAALTEIAQHNPNGISTAGFTRYPVTNLAAGLLRVEKRYSPLPFIAVQTGHATNIRESYSLLSVLLNGARGFEQRSPFRTINPNQPASWYRDPNAPTDALDFVTRFWQPTGDYTEWYFPTRLTLDLEAAGIDTTNTYLHHTLPLWHAHNITLPVLAISAGSGITTPDEYQAWAARTNATLQTHTLPGYAHLDVVAARNDTVARHTLTWLNNTLRTPTDTAPQTDP